MRLLVRLSLVGLLAACSGVTAPHTPAAKVLAVVCFDWHTDATGVRSLVQRPCTVADTAGRMP